MIVFLLLGLVLYKPMVKNATQSDLDAIHGIKTDGVIISRINIFLADNPEATVEDLRQIKGVDDMIIDQLKRKYR